MDYTLYRGSISSSSDKIQKVWGLTMKNAIKAHRTVKCRPAIYNGVDSHKWANKMEIQHLISCKPDVEVMATLRRNRNCIP
jgi:hypothetical protein